MLFRTLFMFIFAIKESGAKLLKNQKKREGGMARIALVNLAFVGDMKPAAYETS